MSYPERSGAGWACPSTHPVALPEIVINVAYAAVGDASLKWRLASDMYPSTQPGGYSAHADWFNGWRPDIAAAWLNNCTNPTDPAKDCHAHLLGDGREIY